ncbi:hypothetical protein GGI07_005943, partial [Coemansia sp. Benny D115]
MGPKPPRPQPQQQQQQQSRFAIDSASGGRRRNTGTAKPPQRTSLDQPARAPKLTSAGSWRAAPTKQQQPEDDNATVAATKAPGSAPAKPDFSLPSSLLSATSEHFQSGSLSATAAAATTLDSAGIHSGTRPRSQTQSVVGTAGESSGDAYYVASGLKSGPRGLARGEHSPLGDLMQIPPASASSKNDSNGGSSDASLPLLPHKMLADILGETDTAMRSGSGSSSVGTTSLPQPVKPIGAPAKAAATNSSDHKETSGGGKSGAAPGGGSLPFASSSIFQISDSHRLLDSSYDANHGPFSWQQHTRQPALGGVRTRHGYFSSSRDPPVSASCEPSAPMQQSGLAAPTAYALQPADQQQWAYAAPAAFSAFSPGAGMLWAEPIDQQIGLDTGASRSFRNNPGEPRTSSRGDGTAGSSNGPHGFKPAGRPPRPIGTRSTSTNGSRNMRSRQGNAYPQDRS